MGCSQLVASALAIIKCASQALREGDRFWQINRQIKPLRCIFLYRQEKQNFKINKKLKGGILTMDWRVLIILVPILVAASWAIFNIGAIALRQAQQFFSKNT